MPSLPSALLQARTLIALLEKVDTFGLKAYLAAHQREVGVTIGTVVTAGTKTQLISLKLFILKLINRMSAFAE